MQFFLLIGSILEICCFVQKNKSIVFTNPSGIYCNPKCNVIWFSKKWNVLSGKCNASFFKDRIKLLVSVLDTQNLEPTTHIGFYVENQRLKQWLSIPLSSTHSHDACHAILVDQSKCLYVKHFKSYSVKFGSWYVFSWNNDRTTNTTFKINYSTVFKKQLRLHSFVGTFNSGCHTLEALFVTQLNIRLIGQ